MRIAIRGGLTVGLVALVSMAACNTNEAPPDEGVGPDRRDAGTDADADDSGRDPATMTASDVEYFEGMVLTSDAPFVSERYEPARPTHLAGVLFQFDSDALTYGVTGFFYRFDGVPASGYDNVGAIRYRPFCTRAVMDSCELIQCTYREDYTYALSRPVYNSIGTLTIRSERFGNLELPDTGSGTYEVGTLTPPEVPPDGPPVDGDRFVVEASGNEQFDPFTFEVLYSDFPVLTSPPVDATDVVLSREGDFDLRWDSTASGTSYFQLTAGMWPDPLVQITCSATTADGGVRFPAEFMAVLPAAADVGAGFVVPATRVGIWSQVAHFTQLGGRGFSGRVQ